MRLFRLQTGCFFQSPDEQQAHTAAFHVTFHIEKKNKPCQQTSISPREESSKTEKWSQLCSPESSVPVSLLGNTDPFTHPLEPTSNSYEVWPRTASWCRGKAGYPKNLFMVSHNWYPSISEEEYNHQPKTCGLPFICPSNKPACPKPVCHRSPKCFQSPEAL